MTGDTSLGSGSEMPWKGLIFVLMGCTGTPPEPTQVAPPPEAPAPQVVFVEACQSAFQEDPAWKAAEPELLPVYCSCLQAWIEGRSLASRHSEFSADPRHKDLAEADLWCRPPAAGGNPEEFGIGD